MALPVLDGNQSATTLSSVVTGGEHIVAHSVVSLGANAIANITSAVSGSVVSVSNFPSTQTIAGTVTANGYDEANGIYAPIPLNDGANAVRVRIDETNGNLPISGTVTVSSLPASTVTVSALPSGALTTRFGSVTTANTAQITSAVTNTSRKYLLAQNISAGTVTIGIGFSPTTTQGIQLTAGGGLTFDAFCPTGAIYWLGAVTGAAFTILEG